MNITKFYLVMITFLRCMIGRDTKGARLRWCSAEVENLEFPSFSSGSTPRRLPSLAGPAPRLRSAGKSQLNASEGAFSPFVLRLKEPRFLRPNPRWAQEPEIYEKSSRFASNGEKSTEISLEQIEFMAERILTGEEFLRKITNVEIFR